MRNKKYKTNHCLKHVLILQTKIKKQINVRTDWTDCIEPPVRSPQMWQLGCHQVTIGFRLSSTMTRLAAGSTAWCQDLWALNINITGKTPRKRPHFLTIDLEQLSSWLDLNGWFSHVHPELLLSLQQLIHFVASSYWTSKLFNRGRSPGNAYAVPQYL